MSDRNRNGKVVFLTTDKETCVTTPVALTKPTAYKAGWFYPDGKPYLDNAGIIPAPTTFVTDCTDIAGKPPAINPGTWSVRVFVDGYFDNVLYFIIKNP